MEEKLLSSMLNLSIQSLILQSGYYETYLVTKGEIIEKELTLSCFVLIEYLFSKSNFSLQT